MDKLCPHCQTNSNTYNMNCIGCCARHVLMMFYPAGTKPIEYAKQVAEKYKHDYEKLVSEIRRLKK